MGNKKYKLEFEIKDDQDFDLVLEQLQKELTFGGLDKIINEKDTAKNWSGINENEMLCLSRRMPNILFKIWGTGNEFDDNCLGYFYNGSSEWVRPNYPEPTLFKKEPIAAENSAIELTYKKIIRRGKKGYQITEMTMVNTEEYSYEYFEEFPHFRSTSLDDSGKMTMTIQLNNNNAYYLNKPVYIPENEWDKFVEAFRICKEKTIAEQQKINELSKKWCDSIIYKI